MVVKEGRVFRDFWNGCTGFPVEMGQ